ncbi:MAG TPA: N-methyl-L-tryptophan oxidase [Phycisphaerae bacterium]|nr:N-methyl-L-tryptophan oxidase [Phycisphaerae bacterium]
MSSFDAIIIGAGAMGTAAAYHLSQRGQRVLLLEQYQIGHEQGSSHGKSRVIRKAYFEDPRYVPLLNAAYELWRELERESGDKLLHLVGCLNIGPRDHACIRGVEQSARDHQLPHEMLAAPEIARRWPIFKPNADDIGLYEQDAGFLLPEACLRAHSAHAIRHGAVVHTGEEVLGWKATQVGVRVQTPSQTYTAGTLIITAGAWLRGILSALRLPLRVERQVQLWFMPDEPARFTAPHMPTFIHFVGDAAYYGIPMRDREGVKVARHHAGETVTPQTVNRSIAPQDEADVRGYIRAHLPGADGPLIDGKVCLYTNSPDDHFIIDRHPNYPNVLIAGGFSGHGFKFAPVVGSILADLAIEGSTRHLIDFFSINRFGPSSWQAATCRLRFAQNAAPDRDTPGASGTNRPQSVIEGGDIRLSNKTAMPFFVPAEETQSPEQIVALQREKLAAMLRAILPTNRFYRSKLGDLFPNPESIAPNSVDHAMIPFTTRAELEQDQAAHPPYGSSLTYPLSAYSRFHQTSGTGGAPMRWLDRAADWAWWKKLWAIVYRAAGVTPADRFVFPFSFGPFIGFWAAFESAVELGNLCLPAGGMTTKARLQFILENEVTVVCCTPTYAIRMAQVAAEEAINLKASKVRMFIVAGEPGGSIPATRQRIESVWGARVFDHAGMTEMGAYAFECIEAPGGIHITESEFIAEVIDPVTSQAVADGVAGELVLTNLGRWGKPLVRYRTGDFVRLVREPCPCGRSVARLVGGLLGRIDDMVTIRGNNVFPPAVEAILRRFDGVVEYLVEVDTSAALCDLRIRIEAAPTADGKMLATDIANAVRDALNFRPVVELAAAGSLPRFEMKANRWRRQKRE